ncbi:hypothetical protein MW887_007548 [Aspergillus wentii]|nr:hypothetical protein MW887_007548 [Aspergillus wentii]
MLIGCVSLLENAPIVLTYSTLVENFRQWKQYLDTKDTTCQIQDMDAVSVPSSEPRQCHYYANERCDPCTSGLVANNGHL